MLFGKIGQQLIRKPLISLLRANRPVHEPTHDVIRAARAEDAIPSELAAVVSHKYTFVISITDRSFMRQTPSFQVHRIATDFGKQLHSSLFHTRASSSHTSYMQQPITQQPTIPLPAIEMSSPSTIHNITPSSELHQHPSQSTLLQVSTFVFAYCIRSFFLHLSVTSHIYYSYYNTQQKKIIQTLDLYIIHSYHTYIFTRLS